MGILGRLEAGRSRIVDSALPRLDGNETQGASTCASTSGKQFIHVDLLRTHGYACRRQLPLDLGEGDKFRFDDQLLD